MSAVMARSPACADFAMYPSATSRPIATRTVETCRDGGNRMVLFATKIALTARRSAARITISFTAEGQASASTKIFTGDTVRESAGAGYLPASAATRRAVEADAYRGGARQVLRGADDAKRQCVLSCFRAWISMRLPRALSSGM